MLRQISHWLFATDNPFDLYGFWPAFLWTVAMLITGVYFLLLETLGIRRVHGMIPLTWFWRCAPRIIWFIIAAVGIWHFAVVHTRVK